MATALSPTHSCLIANSAYSTLSTSTPNIAAAASLNEARELFDVLGGSVFTGTTGLDVSSNFGYVAHGKPGARQGETVITVRGTQTAADWLTNLHMSATRSATGYPVHSGFNQLANSILPQVRAALTGRNPSTIHVAGHSLGGATAALIADSLRSITEVKLYTFGAPRAGTAIHTNYLTQRLGRDNIFRAYHDTDPVPMVPIFPYVHAPTGGTGYLMRGSGAVISVAAHSRDLYQQHATSSWQSMPTIGHRRFSLETVDDVLEMASAVPAGFLSSQLMRLIVKALGLILSGLGNAAGLAALGAATVLDQIAYAITIGLGAVSSGMDMVQRLADQIMRWLGMAVTVTANVTTGFLRWLLSRLFGTIAQMAASAVHRLI